MENPHDPLHKRRRSGEALVSALRPFFPLGSGAVQETVHDARINGPSGREQPLPRRLISGLLAVALSLFPSAVLAEDLLQLYQSAVAADPVLAASEAQRNRTLSLVDQARAPLLPQLTLSADSGFEREAGGGARIVPRGNQSELELTVSQILFDDGVSGRLRASKISATAEEARLNAARQGLRLRLASAYFGAVLAGETYEISREIEAAFAEHVNRSRGLVATGLAAQLDLDQSQAFLSMAAGQTIRAREALLDAMGRIALITGFPPASLVGLRETVSLADPVTEDADHWKRLATERNPDVLAAAYEVAAADQLIDSSRGDALPKVSLEVGVKHGSGTGFGDRNDRSIMSAQVRLSVPLYAGGAIDARTSEARHLRDRARALLETERRNATRTVQLSLERLHYGQQRIDNARRSIEDAQKALTATRTGWQVGTRSTSDLLQAIQVFSSARSTYVQARNDVILARLELAAAVGRLDEEELTRIAALLDPEKRYSTPPPF